MNQSQFDFSGSNHHLFQDFAPAWYISRGNGVYVPLVAADELPNSIELDGVPRQLNEYEASLLEAKNATLVGEVLGSGKNYTLLQPKVLPTKVRWKLSTNKSHGNNLAKPLVVQTPQSIVASLPSPERAYTPSSGILKHLPPSGQEPDESKKEFCSHWIRTGECDYIQQGCRFKHQIPDRKTLASIGFRSVPRWWQEKHTQRKAACSWDSCSQETCVGQIDAHKFPTPANTPAASSASSGSRSIELPNGNPEGDRYNNKYLPHGNRTKGRKARRQRCPRGKKNPLPSSLPVQPYEHLQMTPADVRPSKPDNISSGGQERVAVDLEDLITFDTPPTSPKLVAEQKEPASSENVPYSHQPIIPRAQRRSNLTLKMHERSRKAEHKPAGSRLLRIRADPFSLADTTIQGLAVN